MSLCEQNCKIAGFVLLFIVLWPLILVLGCPAYIAFEVGRNAFAAFGWLGAFLFGMLGFMIGIFLNLCWIPLFIILTLCMLVIGIFQLFRCIFCLGCSCFGRGTSAAEILNINRAE